MTTQPKPDGARATDLRALTIDVNQVGSHCAGHAVSAAVEVLAGDAGATVDELDLIDLGVGEIVDQFVHVSNWCLKAQTRLGVLTLTVQADEHTALSLLKDPIVSTAFTTNHYLDRTLTLSRKLTVHMLAGS